MHAWSISTPPPAVSVDKFRSGRARVRHGPALARRPRDLRERRDELPRLGERGGPHARHLHADGCGRQGGALYSASSRLPAQPAVPFQKHQLQPIAFRDWPDTATFIWTNCGREVSFEFPLAEQKAVGIHLKLASQKTGLKLFSQNT